MLLKPQRTIANIIGAATGLLILAFVLVSYAPSSASPTLGAKITVSAANNGSVSTNPPRTKTFINIADLRPGSPAVAGSFTMSSESAMNQQVSIGLDELTKNLVPDVPFAGSLEMDFGKRGTATLASLATTPLDPFTLKAGETVKIPVSISLPIAAGEQAGGQEATIILAPESTP